jgi:hypothetical protein
LSRGSTAITIRKRKVSAEKFEKGDLDHDAYEVDRLAGRLQRDGTRHARMAFGQPAQHVPALLIEPDCVPVTKNWLVRLQSESTRLFVGADKWLAGAWRNSGGPYGHVNGNCLIRPDIVKTLLPLFGPDLAWDCAIAPWVKSHWYFSTLIANRFQSVDATISDLHGANWYPGHIHGTAELDEYRPVLVHGFKDDSAFNLAKAELMS